MRRPEKSLTKEVNFYGSKMLSGDAARPGKNAAPASTLINQESQHSAGHDYRYRADLEEH